jgi:hypothetical protein
MMNLSQLIGINSVSEIKRFYNKEKPMKIMILLLPLFFVAGVLGGEYTTDRNLILDAKNIKSLKIDCGAGYLKVKGDQDAKTIEVEANIYVSRIDKEEAEEFVKKRVRLLLEQRGNHAYLESGYDHHGSFWGRVFDDHPEVRIDLTVKVPQQIDLRVDDDSGYILIENIDGSVDLDDGSGETTLRDIAGDVWIDDGSGELHLSNIGGDVEIDDGSGEIVVQDVGGDVRVDDGSGSIKISGVEKDVIIGDDGSGHVDITDVKGRIIRHDD